MIYIVIPVFNRIHFTVECLKSLRKQHYRDFQMIVVDDGSTDGTGQILADQFPEVIRIKGNGQLWWTASTNLGVERAIELSGSDRDFVLTLNNDLVVRENYLDELLATAESFPDTLIGSVSVDIDRPEVIHFAGTRWNSKTASYRSAIDDTIPAAELKEQADLLSTDLLPGRGVLIPISVFKKIGLYDQKYFPQYMADEDFALRAIRGGYRLGISPGAIVLNHVQETGLRKAKKNLRYYKDLFTSTKSPVNVTYRWNWAKRHATVPPQLYFTIDFLRILKSLFFKL